MKFLLVFVVLIIISCQAVSYLKVVQEQWEEFKMTYGKQYKSETEDGFRKKIFLENSYKMSKHNKDYFMGLVSYKLGINKYADLLHNEFVQILNGFSKTLNKIGKNGHAITFIPPANVQLPNEVDWRKAGAVTDVKDQESCSSSWSFSATGALEGQHFRKTKNLVSLSEQNLIDCSTNFGNKGCRGGLMQYAFLYVNDNGGIDTETSYPYEAQNGTCRFNSSNVGATDTTFVNIQIGNEKDLQSAVATAGPISAGIDASHETFQLYSQGVYYEPTCSSGELNHAVLVVGYGTDRNGQDYWLVKNSWGLSWGANGYIKMARNKNNNCGIASLASFPIG